MLRLLVLLILTGCASAAVAPAPDLTFQQEICEELELVCDFPEPIVVVSRTVEDKFCFGCRYRGWTYADEPYVFVNSEIPVQLQLQTEYHETVHYVVNNTVLYLMLDSCANEELARAMTAKKYGWEYNDDWKESYNCVKPPASDD